MKCLIIDSVHETIAQELGKFMQVDHKMLPTQAELAEIIPEYDVLIMRVDPAINKEILDAAKNLKVIGVCSVGLNHIDMETAKAKGIQVFNAPGLNANAVCRADHLQDARPLPQYDGCQPRRQGQPSVG